MKADKQLRSDAQKVSAIIKDQYPEFFKYLQGLAAEPEVDSNSDTSNQLPKKKEFPKNSPIKALK